MKFFFRPVAAAAACMVLGSYFNPAKAASNTSLELCGKDGNCKSALCADSVCEPMGKRIAMNKPNGGKRCFK